MIIITNLRGRNGFIIHFSKILGWLPSQVRGNTVFIDVTNLSPAEWIKENYPQANWLSLKLQTSVIPGRKWIIIINVCCLQPRCQSQRHLNYKQLHKLISIILILQKLTSCPEKVKLNVSPRWNLKGHSDSTSTIQLATQLCILPPNWQPFFQKHEL